MARRKLIKEAGVDAMSLQEKVTAAIDGDKIAVNKNLAKKKKDVNAAAVPKKSKVVVQDDFDFEEEPESRDKIIRKQLDKYLT